MKPHLHFTAPDHWINDPNGLIYYQGYYHIFYQHFPYASKWGTMHWGHAITKDFIHYQHLPIALYPSKHYDRNGCFSGSAIEKDNKLYLYYTAIQYTKENPEYFHVQYSDDDLIASQALLISHDGLTFDNQYDKHLILDVIKDSSLGSQQHTRDPKVWKYQNKIHMVVGSKIPYEKGYHGEVLFYESEDGIHFRYKNRFIDESIGDMWECPDIITIRHHYFMIFSPEHINQPPQPVSNAVYMPISFDEDTMEVKRLGDYHYLDYGLDFYAPQTFLDEHQQKVMIGWLRMRIPEQGEDWVGMLSFPRILTQKDGHIYQSVYPTIQSLFQHPQKELSFQQPFLIKVVMNSNSEINLGGLKLYIQNNCLYCDRSAVSIQHEKVCNLNYTPPLHQYHLDIYYDYHVFEIYINDGYFVLSQIVYHLKDEYEIKNVNDYIIYTI